MQKLLPKFNYNYVNTYIENIHQLQLSPNKKQLTLITYV